MLILPAGILYTEPAEAGLRDRKRQDSGTEKDRTPGPLTAPAGPHMPQYRLPGHGGDHENSEYTALCL